MTTQTIKEKVNKYGCKPVGDVCMKHERLLITFGICEDSPELRDFIDSAISQAVKEREESLIKEIENDKDIIAIREKTDCEWGVYTRIINLIKSK